MDGTPPLPWSFLYVQLLKKFLQQHLYYKVDK